MKQLIKLSIVVLSLAGSAAQAAIQTIRAEVKGMVCAFCAQGIEKKMRALSQTQDVYVDLKNKIVAVQLKEGQALSHDAVKILIKDAGYEISKIETVADTAQQIKAAIRGKK